MNVCICILPSCLYVCMCILPICIYVCMCILPLCHSVCMRIRQPIYLCLCAYSDQLYACFQKADFFLSSAIYMHACREKSVPFNLASFCFRMASSICAKNLRHAPHLAMSIGRLCACWFVYMCACWFVYMYACWFVYIFACWFVCMCACWFVYMYGCWFVYMYVRCMSSGMAHFVEV